MPKILKCCILGCQENSRNIIEEISFHRIPKDIETRGQWIDLIRSKTNQSCVFPIEALVCSKHFDKTRFIERVNGSRVLIKNSLPSIFPNEQREILKSDWSDNEEDENTFTDPLQNESNFASSKLDHSFNYENASQKPKMEYLVHDVDTCFIKHEYDEDISSDLLEMTESNDFQKSCRFCLAVPITTQLDNSLSDQDIAEMFKSLTGIEYHCSTHDALSTICTDCSSKLKNAFEFREHLIKMNNRWETWIKNKKAVEEHGDNMLQEQEQTDVQPKLEVQIIDDKNALLESENIESIEYLDDEFLVEEVELADESDEDEKFIQNVQDFIKTVKPTKPNKLKKIPKPPGHVVTAKKVDSLTERLNFRSSSSPHSSQKLKKDNKWFRLMHDCNYCDAKDFLTVDAINKHLKVEHPDLVKVTCDICKKDYSELKYLRKHMKYVHQTRDHVCTVCKKSFYYNYNLKSHMLSHTNEKTAICHLCGKFFTSASLHQHLRSGIHGNQAQDQKNRVQNSKSQRYYCHICVPARRFDLCTELTEHRRLVHKDFECPICKGWFSCMEALQNHLKTHSNKERKHTCTICSSTFVRASHLEGHMRRKHSTDPKPIACDKCDYRCVEPYELTGHKKHSHSKLRPYKCGHCVREFTHGQALKDHILINHQIGEYRYSCSLCSKRFTNSAGLIHHRGVHHSGAGNQPS